MPQAEPHFDEHDVAMRELLALPGVLRVELGLKEQAGQPIDRWAYRVFVRRKRPLEELSPEERVPPEIGGVATDVLTGTEEGPRKDSCTKSLEPGDKIQRFLPNEWQESGTLGFLVRKGTDRFILTNHHVVRDDYRSTPAEALAHEVFDPHRRTCLGFVLNNPAARLIPNFGQEGLIGRPDGNTYDLDATLVTIHSGIEGANRQSDIGALDQGLRDLRSLGSPADPTAPPVRVRVKKRGATTDVTEGEVVGYRTTVTPTGGGAPVTVWRMTITPSPGRSYEKEIEFIPSSTTSVADLLGLFAGKSVQGQDVGPADGGRRRIRFTGHIFSDHGDSGSAIIDEQRRIVGLLFGSAYIDADAWVDGRQDTVSIPVGETSAAYIHPTFEIMGLDPATGVIPPGGSSGGTPVVVPGARLRLQPPDTDGLDELDRELTGTPARELLRSLAARHLGAIIDLIHERRRVLVVWHRSKSLGFVIALLRALREPGERVPAELDGVRIGDALRAMRDVLLIEGDAELRAAIDRHGEWLISLAERCAAASDVRLALVEATA